MRCSLVQGSGVVMTVASSTTFSNLKRILLPFLMATAALLAAICLGLPGANTALAQTVCGVSADGNEPQGPNGSTAVAGSFACGQNASATGFAATAVGQDANAQAGGTSVGTNASSIGASTAAVGAGAVAFGDSSTSIGFASGSGPFVGNDGNTAVGAFAGQLVNGDNNSAVGRNAGQTVVGNANSAFGMNTGDNVTGSSNAAFGLGSGNGVTGSFNIGAGLGAGATVVGSSNAGFGAAAGGQVTGSFNVAAGSFAGTGVTGSSNVAVGENAGNSITGSRNVSIGQNAGMNATANDAVSIGTSAMAAHDGAVAIGRGAATTRADQMMFGTAGATYTMPGVRSAASLAAQTGPTYFVTTDEAGNLAATSFSLDSIASLDSRITALGAKAFEGTAIALAMSGGALPADKDFAVSINWGVFEGQHGFAGTAAARVNDNLLLHGGIGIGASEGTVGGRAGLTLTW
jgi:hypothetical protein